MTAYSDAFDIAADATHILRKQVAVALRRTAVAILAESPATADNPQRVAWARRVIANPVDWAARAIWSVLETAAIRASPTTATDAAVQTACDALVVSLMKAT